LGRALEHPGDERLEQIARAPLIVESFTVPKSAHRLRLTQLGQSAVCEDLSVTPLRRKKRKQAKLAQRHKLTAATDARGHDRAEPASAIRAT
jgi:hypothetical protein